MAKGGGAHVFHACYGFLVDGARGEFDISSYKSIYCLCDRVAWTADGALAVFGISAPRSDKSNTQHHEVAVQSTVPLA